MKCTGPKRGVTNIRLHVVNASSPVYHNLLATKPTYRSRVYFRPPPPSSYALSRTNLSAKTALWYRLLVYYVLAWHRSQAHAARARHVRNDVCLYGARSRETCRHIHNKRFKLIQEERKRVATGRLHVAANSVGSRYTPFAKLKPPQATILLPTKPTLESAISDDMWQFTFRSSTGTRMFLHHCSLE